MSCTRHSTHGAPRTACRSQFSVIWVLRIKLGSSDSASNPFIHGAISPTLFLSTRLLSGSLLWNTRARDLQRECSETQICNTRIIGEHSTNWAHSGESYNHVLWLVILSVASAACNLPIPRVTMVWALERSLKQVLTSSICLFSWCKCPHGSWYRVTKATSLLTGKGAKRCHHGVLDRQTVECSGRLRFSMVGSVCLPFLFLVLVFSWEVNILC